MKHFLPLFICLLTAVAPFFAGCEKDPEIITKTIVETDTVFVADTVFLTVTDTLSLTQFIHDTATTFILTRHAETTGIGTNPGLNADGELRAEELVRLLKNVPLGAVYSTNYNRTLHTAQPVATDKALNIRIYDGFTLDPPVDEALAQQRGGVVLIMGHSNTTASMLNLLTGTSDYATLPDTQYDNMYVVTVFEKGRGAVVHLKYGKETP